MKINRSPKLAIIQSAVQTFNSKFQNKDIAAEINIKTLEPIHLNKPFDYLVRNTYRTTV